MPSHLWEEDQKTSTRAQAWKQSRTRSGKPTPGAANSAKLHTSSAVVNWPLLFIQQFPNTQNLGWCSVCLCSIQKDCSSKHKQRQALTTVFISALPCLLRPWCGVSHHTHTLVHSESREASPIILLLRKEETGERCRRNSPKTKNRRGGFAAGAGNYHCFSFLGPLGHFQAAIMDLFLQKQGHAKWKF